MILDPRLHRIDDLLRGAYFPGETPFPPRGPNLWAGSPRGWGLGGDVRWGGETPGGLAPFTLRLFADGDEVFPEGATARPSHVTLHAVAAPSGLQVTEDKFLTSDDVAVSVLRLRNPHERGVELAVEVGFGFRSGVAHHLGGPDAAPVFTYRDGPPGDDLYQLVPSDGRRALVFAVAFAASESEARARALRWSRSPDPVRAQADAVQSWFDHHVPRFDCPDPWLTRLWHLDALRRFRRGDVPDPSSWIMQAEPSRHLDEIRTRARAEFVGGDFDRPRLDGAGGPWAATLLGEVLGITSGANGGLRIDPTPAAAVWPWFCFEDVPCGPDGERRLAVVWDDPAEPEDAFGDGDKGLTVYLDGRRVHHQWDLASLRLPPPGPA